MPRFLTFFALLSAVLCGGLWVSIAAPSLRDMSLEPCWTTGDSNVTALVSDLRGVYLATADGRLNALTLAGEKLWSIELGGAVTSKPVIAGDQLLVATNTIGGSGQPSVSRLRSLSVDTGVVIWNLDLPSADRHFLIPLNDDLIVVTSSGIVQSVTRAKAAIKWRRQIADSINAEPYASQQRVHVPVSGSKVFSIAAATGEIIALRTLSFDTQALTEDERGWLITGDERGNVTLISPDERVKWRFKTGGAIISLHPLADSTLVVSLDNFIYHLHNRSGDVLWKRRLAGRSSFSVPIDRKFLVTSTTDEHGAKLIDLITGKAAAAISLAGDENLVSAPVQAGPLVLVPTNRAFRAYSLEPCSPITEKAAQVDARRPS